MDKKITWQGATQLAPLPVVLVTTADAVRQNVFTVAWTGIVCSTPPMLSISVRKERFSHPMICESREVTVNIPPASLAEEVDRCGVLSGREYNKFTLCHFTPIPGETVKSPVISECPVSLECKVSHILELGSHDLFIAHITAVRVSERLIDEKGRLQLESADLLAYAHGHYHRVADAIGHFGFSVRKKAGPKVRS
ncbi:MAG: flavin reductase family protein [Lentisphaeria bacterium]|nr:flavin reductase family protein [Lentisphaeria bacterium]